MAGTGPFAQNQVFDPETTRVMAAAFDSAWERLQETGKPADREALAKRILDAAQRGERDPIRLRDDAIAFVRDRTPPHREPG